DIGHPQTAGDRSRTLVNHSIPEPPSRIILRRLRCNEVAPQPSGQLIENRHVASKVPGWYHEPSKRQRVARADVQNAVMGNGLADHKDGTHSLAENPTLVPQASQTHIGISAGSGAGQPSQAAVRMSTTREVVMVR